MKIEHIQCPACGADLDIPKGKDSFFCQYCGASVHVNDEVQRKEVVHRKIDEAEIVKSNNEIELKKLEMEAEKRSREMRRNILIGCAIAFVLLMAFLFFTGNLD